MPTYPTRVDAFLAWSKLMAAQATVPERVSYKGKGSLTSSKSSHKKRKRRIRRNRRKRHNRVFKE